MSRESVWTNSDGLRVGFGTRAVTKTVGAQPSLGGARQQVVVDIRGADLADTDVARQLAHGVIIPADALLESAKLVVTTQFVGVSATMDIGIYKAGATGTDDDDGIDVAIATASLTDNAVITCDGAKIGTVLDAAYKVGVSWDTAAFTAGEATLVVEYVLPAN